MLWQGAGAPGPFMLSMFEPLVSQYRVYAPDTPGRGGRSEPVDLDPASHEWGSWCVEVMQGLGLLKEGVPPPLHMGVSMGGCAFLDLAHVAPLTVRCAALIVPGSLHPDWGTRWHALCLGLCVSLPMALYCLLPCRWTAWLGLWALTDDPWTQMNDPVVQQLLLMFRYATDMSGKGLPARFEAEQLAGLKAPVLVVAAEHDVFGAAMATRARQVIPNCAAETLAGAKHCFSQARMEEACQRAMQFFRGCCGAD